MKSLKLVILLVLVGIGSGIAYAVEKKLSPPAALRIVVRDDAEAKKVGDLITILADAGIPRSNSMAVVREVLGLSEAYHAEKRKFEGEYQSRVLKVLSKYQDVPEGTRTNTSALIARLPRKESTPLVMTLVSQGATGSGEGLVAEIMSLEKPTPASLIDRAGVYLPILRKVGARNPDFAAAQVAAMLDR